MISAARNNICNARIRKCLSVTYKCSLPNKSALQPACRPYPIAFNCGERGVKNSPPEFPCLGKSTRPIGTHSPVCSLPEYSPPEYPPEGTWYQRYPRKDMGREIHTSPMDRMTDRCHWKHYLPQYPLRAVITRVATITGSYDNPYEGRIAASSKWK